MCNSTIRTCFCAVYNIFRTPIVLFCGLPPFLRRSVCGGLILCGIYPGGIRQMWNHLCCVYNSIRRTLFYPVKVYMLVAGETFQAHETFIEKLKLQIEFCSAESSNIILVFCPVVSRIGTDMEAAMARVTVNKPVILVFMHHCHSPSQMTNITVQPSRSNIVQVVHCAFYEHDGLLQCRENNQAVSEVRTMLEKYQRRKRPSSEMRF